MNMASMRVAALMIEHQGCKSTQPLSELPFECQPEVQQHFAALLLTLHGKLLL